MTDQFTARNEVPLVTVVMPTYNRMPLIIEAINSVIAQTYTNWELIIIDDGSTDGTHEAVKNINDERINLISLSHTGNISDLRNTGVKHSRGEWFAEKLQLQMETLVKENKRWVYGLFEYVDKNKEIIYKSSERFIPFSGNIIKEVIMAKTGITICSVVLEKKLFNEIGGFSSNLKIKGDYEFLLRLALKAEAAITEKIIMLVRDHPNRTYRSVTYSYELSASIYKSFINLRPGKQFEKLARRRIAYFLSEASVNRFSKGYYRIALQQLGQSIWMGDRLRHWLSAVKRGLWNS